MAMFALFISFALASFSSPASAQDCLGAKKLFDAFEQVPKFQIDAACIETLANWAVDAREKNRVRMRAIESIERAEGKKAVAALLSIASDKKLPIRLFRAAMRGLARKKAITEFAALRSSCTGKRRAHAEYYWKRYKLSSHERRKRPIEAGQSRKDPLVGPTSR